MAVLSIKNGIVSRSMLVGNEPFSPSSFESIQTYTGNGTDTTMTFGSIPATYSSLQLRCLSRGVAGASRITMRFNGDATGYTTHNLSGDGLSATALGYADTGYLYLWQSVADSSWAANILGAAIIDIHDYASTTLNKTVRCFAGMNNNTTSTYQGVALSSGVWINTDAVTSISLNIDGAAFTTSTTFALYGVK